MNVLFAVLTVLAVLALVKIAWVGWSCRGNGDFDKEKTELLQRRNYLVENVVVGPQQLLDRMPQEIGSQFEGEWALYSCSMLAEALSNMAQLYPEPKDEAIATVDSLIGIVTSPELRAYDAARWGADPLESLEGDESHVSYLSHLAWVIGNYKRIGGGDKYDELYDSVCLTMNRRIVSSPLYTLPTYPYESVYVPDMLVAIVALSDYAKLREGRCAETVRTWIDRAKSEWIDDETGLLVSFLGDSGKTGAPVKGLTQP